MNARFKFSIGAIIILGTLVWLGWVGASQSKTYYHTISELGALEGSALRQRMRVSGNVVDGSIAHHPGRIDFILTEEGKTLPVSYVGDSPLPDTFKGGAEALAEGKLMPDGHFEADQVQAKCASKYQATPGQRPAAASPQTKSETQAQPDSPSAAAPRT
ncbi:MAG TPA: cytochrome c maturation protein CcmE [Candidatus Acidoferrales bacterium]|nr:cytochrome c maturation protein CcmE [Candidatus Acidoferrales bacterium]